MPTDATKRKPMDFMKLWGSIIAGIGLLLSLVGAFLGIVALGIWLFESGHTILGGVLAFLMFTLVLAAACYGD